MIIQSIHQSRSSFDFNPRDPYTPMEILTALDKAGLGNLPRNKISPEQFRAAMRGERVVVAKEKCGPKAEEKPAPKRILTPQQKERRQLQARKRREANAEINGRLSDYLERMGYTRRAA